MALDTQLGVQILFTLGITNVIFLLLVASSCRCMGMHNLTRRFMNYSWYLKFYNKHCYYWYGFFISVLLHATLAIYLFGIPF
ncbi:MAG TPA: hypothetical protein VJC00_03375 [Candidatus Nanoarchaeia archaeon]|nr:hypothetical protein [Candidatus Nanoarchaeia archaeon]